MPQFFPGFHVTFNKKKKGPQGKMPPFSQDFDVISKKNKNKRSSVFHILISQCHFDGPSAGPPEAHGPPNGPPT